MAFVNTDSYEKMVSTLTFNQKALIDGKLVDSISGKAFDTINPGTEKVITPVTSCCSEDVKMAIKAARKSFDDGSWS